MDIFGWVFLFGWFLYVKNKGKRICRGVPCASLNALQLLKLDTKGTFYSVVY